MNELARTPMMIAAEINGIKEQVRTTVAIGAIEIGRRLIEAKQLLPHGEWKGWLQEHVNYSERTAQNMMQLAHEYRDGKAQAIADFSYTKAMLLLGVPAEEREDFLSAHDVESMSTRELKEEIALLRQKNEEMQLTMDDMLAAAAPLESNMAQENRALRDDLDKARNGLELAKEIKKADDADKQALKEKIQELNARDIEEKGRAAEKEKALEDEIARLKEELTQAGQPIIQQVTPPETEAEMAKLRAQANRGKTEAALRAGMDALTDTFSRLLPLLSALETEDGAAGQRYRGAICKGLQMMQDKIKGEQG